VSSQSNFCHNCGSPLLPGSAYCPRCGTPVAAPQGAAPPQAPPSGYPYRYRRYEKQEKQEKKEKGEKGEKGGRSTTSGLIGAIVGGLILVWLGVTFYLQQIGYLTSDWWAYFVAGIGVILILQGGLLYATGRRVFYGPFIGGVILFLIGLGFIANYNIGFFWPLIFVVIGAAIILSAFVGRRRRPMP
jgi:zinc-ribbon domain